MQCNLPILDTIKQKPCTYDMEVPVSLCDCTTYHNDNLILEVS